MPKSMSVVREAIVADAGDEADGAMAEGTAVGPVGSGRKVLPIVEGVVLIAALVAPLAVRWLEAARSGGFRRFAEVERMLPRPESWLWLGDESWLYGWLGWLPAFREIRTEDEQRVGLGLVTTAVAAAGLWGERARPAVRITALAGTAVVLLATAFPFGIVPWKAVYYLVPGAGAVRAVARIGTLLLFPAALGVAFALDDLRRKNRLALACVLEQAQSPPSFEKAPVRARVAALAHAVDRGGEAFLYAPVAPPGAPGVPGAWLDHQLDAMWAYLETGVPTLNGYYGRFPRGWALLTTGAPDDEPRLARALAAWSAASGLDPARIQWIRAEPSR